jgi:hypothetical protein
VNCGQLNILKWLVSVECTVHAQCISFAAEIGHLDIIGWYISNNYVVINRATECAAEAGHLDALILLVNAKYNIRNYCMDDDISPPHVVKWLKDNYVKGIDGYLVAK